MASSRLTFDECWALIRKLIQIVNVHFHTMADGTALNNTGQNFTSLEAGIKQSIDGSRARQLLDGLAQMRSDAVSFLLGARQLYILLVLELARTSSVNSPAGDDFERAFRDSWLYMHVNSKWVRRRIASYGTPAAGTTTGTGKWYRCTQDLKGYLVENPQADVYTAECKQDKTTGASSGQEVFELRGRTAGQDLLEQLGLGLSKQLVVASEANGLLDDAGFEGDVETSGTTLVGEWETDDAADWLVETSTVFRGSQSLKVVNAGSYARQLLRNINRSVPHFAGIRLRDHASRTGTARLTLGGKTADYTLGQTTGWVDIVIGATSLTINSDAWPDNWINGDSYFRFEILSAGFGGSGDLFFDSAILQPMTEFGGLYHTLTAGATDWKAGTPGDVWTATDTFSDIGIIQYWTKLLLGRYWPHKATGSYNITEPSGVT